MPSWRAILFWLPVAVAFLPPVARVLATPLFIVSVVFAILVACGLLVLTSNILLGVMLDRYYVKKRTASRRAGRPLLFSTPAAWQAALTKDQWSYRPPQSLPPLLPDMPAASKSIGEIMIYIVRDFVLRWYTDISTSPTFPTAVSSTLHASAEAMISRVGRLDIPQLIVRKVLPQVTTHVKHFRESENAIRGTSLERHLTRSEELDILLSSRYAVSGKLHPAVANLSTMSTRQSEEEYLRRLLDRILPLVLPEKEAGSRSVVIAVREIVACAVLAPMMDVFADPDFWNRAIDQTAEAALQKQHMITKVRHVLESGTRHESAPGYQPESITLGTDIKHFEAFLRSIARTNSLLDARRMKNDIGKEMRHTAWIIAKHEDDERIEGYKTEDVVAHLDRLNTAKRLVEKRIHILGGGFDESSIHNQTGEGSVDPTLRDVLLNTSSLSYFTEFMDRRGRAQVVQFWHAVESFKDPLETYDTDLSDIADENADSEQVPSSSTQEDLAYLIERYFAEGTHSPVLSIVSAQNIELIRSVALVPDTLSTTADYKQARKAVLLAQKQVEREMEQDFLDFKESNLWFLAIKDMGGRSQHQSLSDSVEIRPQRPSLSVFASTRVQPTTSKSAKGDIGRGPGLSSSPSPSLSMRSLQQSLGEGSAIRSVSNLSTLMGQTEPSATGRLRSPLFGDATDSLSVTSAEQEDGQKMAQIQAALTDIIAHERFTKEKEVHLDGGIESHPIFSADADEGPNGEDDRDYEGGSTSSIPQQTRSALLGDWELDAIISQIDQTIRDLDSQGSMLNALIRKAELTGDQQRLALLEESKESLAREIRALTFQKDQYKQQAAENNLIPGRTRVAIVDTTSDEEDGKAVIRYLVEVKQLDAEGNQGSGWVIARRYNEFLAMHQKLKDKYAVVRTLEFPGKRLVTAMSTSTVESRKVALEKYLQSLVDMPIVCGSKELLTFVSRESPLQVPAVPKSMKGSRANLLTGQNIVRSVYKSVAGVAGGLDEMLYGSSMLDVVIQRLNAQAASIAGIVGAGVADEDLVARAFKANAEAKSVAPEDRLFQLSGGLAPLEGETSTSSFSAPICDLILAVFELDRRNNWLRRQATVIILQQVLGSTIERKFRDTFKSYTDEGNILSVINIAREDMWPKGQLKESRESRSEEERSRTRHGANQKLAAFMPDLVASMIGRSNARRGARRIFSVLQNRRLNQHILYTVLDEVVSALFPEIAEVEIQKFPAQGIA